MRQIGAIRSAFLVAACIAAAGITLTIVLPDGLMVITVLASLACGLSVLSTALAYAAWKRSGQNETRVLSLARALDQIRQGTVARASVPDFDAISGIVAREVERFAIAATPDVRGPAAPAVPAARPPASASNLEPMLLHPKRSAGSDRQAAVDMALANGRLAAALRPIVQLSRGEAAAFDTFAEFALPGEPPFHLARLHAEAPAADRARFAGLLVGCAIEATRRVVAGASDAPLHVPVSRVMLEANDATLLERLRAHGRAARSLVLDVPAVDLPAPDISPSMLDELVDAGVGLCVDLGDERSPDMARYYRVGARQVRLSASRLLGHTVSRGRGASGPEIVSAAIEAGLAVIADDVSGDDEALALVDLGVDLMSGDRFSLPRRLRDQPGEASLAAAE